MSTNRTSRARRAVLAIAATALLTSVAAIPAAAAEGYPYVVSTSPADGDANVPKGANLTVTFSEPVEVDDGWFHIDCGSSLEHAAVVSGGPVTWTLNPTKDFTPGESCALSTVAALINDKGPEMLNPLSNGLYGFTVAGTPPPPVGNQPPAQGGNTPPKATFVGFKSPHKAVNRAWAGWFVPIKFTLAGAPGRHTIAIGSKQFKCGTTPPAVDTLKTVRGPWAIRVNKRKNTYVVAWKTSRSWRHTCRVFVLTVNGGAPQTLTFKFR